MADKMQMLRTLDQVSFCLDDLLLYLDTHPQDQEALALYQELCAQRREAVQEFEANFYPLTKDSENSITKNMWTWGTAPLPWEAEANVEL